MPIRATARHLIFALGLLCAGALRAQTTLPLGSTALQEAIAKAQEAVSHEDCAGVLGALDPIEPGLPKGEQRTLIQRMRLICLGSMGRGVELSAVQKELVETLPRDGLVLAFGVLIAADENRFTDAADQIVDLADSSPRALQILTGAAVREIAQRLSAERAHDARSRMMVALTRADWEPGDVPELRASFAEGAIEALVDQGQVGEAEGLLDRIDQPETLSAMLIDRRYSRIWPALEARLGPAGGTAVDRFARDRIALFGDTPDSEVALRDAADAMLLLGRYQDVVDLTEGAKIDEEISRDGMMTILYRARALAALRREDAADRLFATFLPLDIRRIPAAVTVLVSYAEYLDEIGKPARALAVARDTRLKAGDLLNDLGKRWVDRTEVCALSALGRATEANQAMDVLKRLADQNQAAAIEALLCAHRDAEASQLAVKALADRDAGGDLLIQFQPGPSLWAATPSRLRDLWTAFLARPEVKAAFDRKGRILPRAYWPAPTPRAIPRRPGNGDMLV